MPVPTMNVGFRGQSGSSADIAKPTLLTLRVISLTLSGHRLRHVVNAPITTIKILTVAPELRSGRAWVRSNRLVIWKNDGLLRLYPAWHRIHRCRLRAGSILASRSVRSHLISDVDRPQERLIIIYKYECASRS